MLLFIWVLLLLVLVIFNLHLAILILKFTFYLLYKLIFNWRFITILIIVAVIHFITK